MKKTYKLWLIPILILGISLTSQAQFNVSGTVLESVTGEPLAGATVVVKGTTQGVVTGADGNYSIRVESQSATLEFSFIGYISQEFQLNGSRSGFNVTLAEDVANLEEVVVTGLASSVKRSNLGNAVATVSAKELTGTTSPQTLDGALYGKLTGANIVQNSGAPGGGISMKLRGISTITGSSEPLYIVDGVYMDNSAVSAGTNPVSQASTSGAISTTQDNPSNRIADLNPEDIENIEILKGASAAAIYGARANAGVVIITTKRGKSGKTNVNFSQDLGFTTVTRLLGMRNYTNENVLNDFGEDELALFQQANASGNLVDYEKEMYGNIGFLRKSAISVSGGNDKTKFFVSGSTRDEEGIIESTGYQRHSIRANIDHKISEVFNVTLNSNYINSSADRGLTNNDNSGTSFGVALSSTRPWADLFPVDGIYPNNPYAASNPLQTRDLSTINESTNRFLTGADLGINIVNRNNMYLKLGLKGGIDYYNNQTKVHFPENLQFMETNGLAGFYSKGNNTSLNINTSAFLVYNVQAGDVNLTSQLGASRLDFSQDRTTTQATELIGAQQNLEQGVSSGIFNRILKTTDIGYSFQQEMNYNDILIATVGVRADKSSLNGDPNKMFFFPKGSLALNIANFDFWNVNGFNQLKLRAAYGEAGGVPAPNQVTLQQAAFTTFNGITVDGTAGSNISNTRGNPDIQPERSRELELGVDLGFIDNRITLEASVYQKNVDDLILTAEVPTSSGFTFQTINGGGLQNRGLELALGATPINSRKVRWDAKTNFWLNRSEITRLDIPAFITGGFSTALGAFKIEKGQPATQIVGVVPGVDGDAVTGNSEPDFQMSLYNYFSFFSKLELSFLFHWKQGGDNINLTRLLTDFGNTSSDYDNDDDGDGVVNGEQRKAAIGVDTRLFVEDATYVKLREVALYYNFGSMFNNVISNVKVGVSANNLLLYTKYTSYDPEVSNFGNNGISTGVEVTPFPSASRYFFHLMVSF